MTMYLDQNITEPPCQHVLYICIYWVELTLRRRARRQSTVSEVELGLIAAAGCIIGVGQALLIAITYRYLPVLGWVTIEGPSQNNDLT